MKKTGGYLLILLLAAGLLAGCMNVPSAKPVPAAESEQVQTVPETASQTETELPVQTETADTAETILQTENLAAEKTFSWEKVLSLDDIPPFTGEAVIEINGNVPFFTEEDLRASSSFVSYSDLDGLGRCAAAYGCVGTETEPAGERTLNDQIHPSGWHSDTYDFVDQLYLYNRCHLIAYSIAGSNGDPRNLITGTRYMNTKGMLPYENKVLRYIEETDNHVLYRVTPVFEGDNLVASGVLMEAYSLEDAGSGLMYCVYAYNVQPGIRIDYLTGDNEEDGSYVPESEVSEEDCRYVVNLRSEKIHLPDCESVKKMSELNKWPTNLSLEDLIKKGYEPCQNCLSGQQTGK